jgi:hypothetical protein
VKQQKVILINGLKRSGKDYLSEKIAEIVGENNVEIISFANPMKEIIANTFGISLNELEEYKNDTEGYGLEIKAYPNNQPSSVIAYTNFRKILQRFGTEGMKPIFGENVWAELGINNVLKSEKEYILIPDFRFLSEYSEAKTKSKGNYKLYTVNIFNDNLPQADAHASETELKEHNFKFDYIIDNTGQPDIEGSVNKFLNEIIS